MSIKAVYVDVFKPIEEVTDAVSGKTYRVFSEEELRDFWDNQEDAVYDNL